MKKTTTVALSIAMLCLFMAIPALASATAIAAPSDVFAALPQIFTFASGAGGWGTEVHINADGTFSGHYEDSNMGDRGDGYPNGTRYECYFSGTFTDITRINDFEYSMRVATLRTEGVKDEEKIIDGVKVITADPYGFDNAGEFRLYLPGLKTSDLPQGYLDWVGWPLTRGSADSSRAAALPFYGLYNVGGEQGFYSDDVITASPSQFSSQSSSQITGIVTVTYPDTVSVRNRPSEDGNRLVRIGSGKSYPCVGQDALGWYKVFVDGYIGYVPSNLVAFSAQDTQASYTGQILGVITITSNDFANIRSTPSQTGDWLAGVSPGVALDCIDVAENGWYCVVLPSGQIGYVSNKLCSFR